MVYRVCKAFEIESGHMLSKHPGRCRFPHGHSRRIEVVLASPRLDDQDMVCDFAAIKAALEDYLDGYDHAMLISSEDPLLDNVRQSSERVMVIEGQDPTTEVLAQRIYDYLKGLIDSGAALTTRRGRTVRFPEGVRVERVRVGETSTSWAEYGDS